MIIASAIEPEERVEKDVEEIKALEVKKEIGGKEIKPVEAKTSSERNRTTGGSCGH